MCASVTKQYNLVISLAGKVTVGLVECNGMQPTTGFMTKSLADCQETGISSEPNAHNRVWDGTIFYFTYLYTYVYMRIIRYDTIYEFFAALLVLAEFVGI